MACLLVLILRHEHRLVDGRAAAEWIDELRAGWGVRTGRAVRIDNCRPLTRFVRGLAFVLDNFSPHLTTKTDSRVGEWAATNEVELAYVPFYASSMNRIEAQFTGLRYFALDGTDHPDHAT